MPALRAQASTSATSSALTASPVPSPSGVGKAMTVDTALP